MTLKELLAMALMQLVGAAAAYDNAFWKESVVGNEVVNFHTNAERNVHSQLQGAIDHAQMALNAAAAVNEKESSDEDLVTADFG